MADREAWLVGTTDHSVFFEVDGRLEPREPSMAVTGSGQDADASVLVIGSVGATLTGTWSGQPIPVPLAYAAAR